MPPPGDVALSTGMCPDWELNLQPFSSQAMLNPLKPHQPGIDIILAFFSYKFLKSVLI